MAQSLLFITASRIGDAVMTTALLDHMVRTHPDLKVTVACGRLAAPLFANVPGLERIIIIDKKRWNLHWINLWRQTVTRRWDMLIDLRVSAVSWLLPVRKRYWQSSTAGKNPAHRLVRMSRMLGLETPPWPRLWPAEANRKAARALVPEGAPVVALAPWANWYPKEWPAERFAELIRRLSAPGARFENARFALIGSAHESTRADLFRELLDDSRRIELFGHPDLLDIQAVLERCALFVGNDSGAMHMAAAAGIPTVGLFGPTRDWLYAPAGPKAITVRDTGIVGTGPWDHPVLDPLPPDMSSLSVETVEQAIGTLFDTLETTPV
ncbi:glycosyltransferase family 9 protein [Phaeovibrio sulfidiphilus]|uniref:Glycosyltransferase family 9 protein n=1 Tax=Phaeovibrio sulfidiphilus TaxID=1220600 RepID=A0A8J6YPA1_9PROT|nr:glycosyltransferase family 9 protein [Phaeovibrio sulfidiphilus]MBE1236697.1 glycosyltransferase family 9 protein [Phaeovibrio sulfidiphilus]